MMRLRAYFVGIGLLLLSTSVQAQRAVPVLLEGEVGVERFSDAAVRSVFPVGANLRLGPAFVMASEGRLRLRPQVGLKLFLNEIEEGLTEHLLFFKLGGQVCYDLFYIGQTTFFPYVAAEFNWVSNFDAERYADDDVSFSENYLRGSGWSQEMGFRVQWREVFLKAGCEFFNPTLRARQSLIEEDLAAGYVTPESQVFRFHTLNISIGFSLFP